MSEIDKRDLWPDEEDVIFVSDETYKGVHRALDHMEKAREELRKAAEAGKPDHTPQHGTNKPGNT
jgi:hypothetical protein